MSQFGKLVNKINIYSLHADPSVVCIALLSRSPCFATRGSSTKFPAGDRMQMGVNVTPPRAQVLPL
jgi:hypothetical protein